MQTTRTLRYLAIISLLLMALAAPMKQAHASTTLYTVTDLGTLGGPYGEALHIDNQGDVTGISSIYSCCFFPFEPFLWKNGVMHDLGTLGGPPTGPGNGPAGIGRSVNQNQQVVGQSGISADGVHSLAFLWQNGVMHDLGSLGGTFAMARSINSRGQIAGGSNTTGDTAFHAFRISNGVMSDLGTLGGTFSGAQTINERGDVAGFSTLPGELIARAFLWSGGTMTDLGTLGGPNGSSFPADTRSINNADQVIGNTDTTIPDPTTTCSGAPPGAVSEFRAFLWTSGKMSDIGSFPGDPDTFATSINNRGQIVGQTGNACNAFHTVIWQNGTVTDLNTLIPASSGWVLITPDDINDQGQIVGAGCQVGVGCDNGLLHALLLTPGSSSSASARSAAQIQASVQAAWARLPANGPARINWHRPSPGNAPWR